MVIRHLFLQASGIEKPVAVDFNRNCKKFCVFILHVPDKEINVYFPSATLYYMKEMSATVLMTATLSRFSVCLPSLTCLHFPILSCCWFPPNRHTTHLQHPPACKAGGSFVWPVLTLFHLHITRQPFTAAIQQQQSHTHASIKKKTSCSLCQPIKSHLGLDSVRISEYKIKFSCFHDIFLIWRLKCFSKTVLCFRK